MGNIGFLPSALPDGGSLLASPRNRLPIIRVTGSTLCFGIHALRAGEAVTVI